MFQTDNKEVQQAWRIIKKFADNHAIQTYMIILACMTSVLAKKFRKFQIWVICIGGPGIGKSRSNKELVVDMGLFQNSVFVSDFSPEAFTDIVCEKYSELFIVVIPELDETLGGEDKMLMNLKNLRDGQFMKVLKKDETIISYDFRSIIMSGVNVIRNGEKYAPMYDRFMMIPFVQSPEQLLTKERFNGKTDK